MSTILAVAGASTIAPVTSLAANKAAENTRPNVLIMLADDMGYDDMSLRGNEYVNTPNLDKLAEQSTRFENFYVHSVSAPTRASLLTGRHFLRAGISGVHAGRDFLNLDEVTIADAFQQAGYATGMWGKWHSGKSSGYFPWERGFDEAFMADLYKYENNKGLFNGETLKTEGWTDAVLADMAIEFIKENKDEQFFAYVPFLSPHGIWKAPEEYVNRKMDQGQSLAFATLNGMIEHLDDQVGKIYAALEDEGLLDNTIIIFLSDNGPIRHGGGPLKITDEEWSQRNPSQYKGNKGQNFENGIHSPLFVYWKGHYETAVNESLVAVYDLFPTLCDITNVEIPAEAKKMDGVSIKKILEDPTITDKDRSLYISQWTPFFKWHDSSGEQQSKPLTPSVRASIDADIQMIGVRNEDYKMLYNMWGEDTVALWNIKDDYKETKNLYLKGTDEDKKAALEYRVEVVDWYNDLLANDKSHQMPTFQIGLEEGGKTVIFCYAPIELADGLLNTNHNLSGFNEVGEFAQYKVNVVKPGKYGIGIRADNKFKGEATFKIYTNLDDNCGEVTIKDKTTTFTQLKLTEDVTFIGIELLTPTDSEFNLVNLDILYK